MYDSFDNTYQVSIKMGSHENIYDKIGVGDDATVTKHIFMDETHFGWVV